MALVTAIPCALAAYAALLAITGILRLRGRVIEPDAWWLIAGYVGAVIGLLAQ